MQFIVLLLMSLLATIGDSQAQHPEPVRAPKALVFKEAYLIESDILPELSGLTYVDGKLLTVSDKHQEQIFSIIIKNGAATLENYLHICSPDVGKLDLEGITSDSAGNLFVLSERQSRILCFPKGSDQGFWFTPSFKKEGNNKNLLLQKNTGFEGLAFLAPNLFVACAEREDRGLISWKVPDMEKGGADSIIALNCDESKFGNVKNRNLDFAGACFFGEKLVVLQRNSHVVSVISGYRSGAFEETQAWSYEHVENDPNYRYKDRRYGLGEGICIVDDLIYIVFDNNRDTREIDEKDRRPLLLVFEKPDDL